MKLTKEDREKIVKEFGISERSLFYYKKDEQKQKWLKAFLLYTKIKEEDIQKNLEEILALTILCCKDKDKKEIIMQKIQKLQEITKIED